MQSYLDKELVRTVLLEKTRRNPAYSLRALGRDLGVSHSYLSYVLNSKRPLSRRLRLALDGRLSPATRNRFRIPQTQSKPISLSVDQFALISEWYHLPLLELLTLPGVSQSSHSLSRRLGLSQTTVKLALERLERLGFLSFRNEKFTVLFPSTRTLPTNSHRAVRVFQGQMLEKAKSCMKQTSKNSYQKREISSMTFKADPEKMALARKKVQRFKRQLSTFMSNGNCSEVYQLNIQLFQITKREK